MADSFTVLWVGTVLFALLWIAVSLILSKYVKSRIQEEEDKELYGRMTIGYVSLAVAMMYIMWICCVLHQLNPLIYPDLSKPITDEVIDSARDDIIL